MPKFTDTFMLVPVRAYNTELEDVDETNDYATAWARIHYTDLITATWYQGYKEMMGIQAEANNGTGFNITVIRTPNAYYLCTLTIKEFERQLNIFMRKVDKIMEVE
ncbi:hypothetical protein GP486_008828, partial [Trichoglossum hirsutum]